MIPIGKVWTDIDRLSVIWISDLFDKMKWEFFQAVAVSVLQYRCTSKTFGEKVKWELHKDGASCFEQILEAAPNKTAAARPVSSYFTNYKRKMKKSF